MGNKMCCQQNIQQSKFNQEPQIQSHKKQKNQSEFKKSSQINQQSYHQKQNKIDSYQYHSIQPQKLQDKINTLSRPQLQGPIQQHLENYAPFAYELKNQNNKIIQFDKDCYEGTINEAGRPDGFGKMYKQNGALFVGKFQNGKAQGPGEYICPDGSFYRGQMSNNYTKDEKGLYRSHGLQYTGGFERNLFHGRGQEKSQYHKFEGQFQYGQRKQGLISWKDNQNQQNTYKGQFDNLGKFTGIGQLTGPTGKYVGDFHQGMKSGKGIYEFTSGMRYEGEYFENQKCGQGQLFGKDNQTRYKGKFQNDLPNGDGVALSNGVQVRTSWINGIDERVIQKTSEIKQVK